MTCNNCGARMSCGCQKRRASDGKSCCSNCISFYEKSLQDKKTISPTPTVTKSVWGTTRYSVNK